MSRENLEVMGTWIEAFNRGDMEALLAVTHPDFEFRTSGVFPDLEPIYKGHAGFKRFYDDFTGPWKSFSVSVQGLRRLRRMWAIACRVRGSRTRRLGDAPPEQF
jgi:ketosteroid isomerase-like protein